MRSRNYRKRTAYDRIQDEITRTRYLKQAKKLRKEIEPVLDQLGYGPKQGWGVGLDSGVRLYVRPYLERANPIIQIEAFLFRNDRTHKLLDHNQIGVECPVEEWQRLFLRRIDAMRKAVAEHLENVKCPHCDDVMVMRKVKQEGELHGAIFWGCVRFPECRGMDAPWKKTMAGDDGKHLNSVACPECQHPLAIRSGSPRVMEMHMDHRRPTRRRVMAETTRLKNQESVQCTRGCRHYFYEKD